MDHPILGQIALSYSPVIDRNRAVTATRLTVWPINPSQRLDAAALLALYHPAGQACLTDAANKAYGDYMISRELKNTIPDNAVVQVVSDKAALAELNQTNAMTTQPVAASLILALDWSTAKYSGTTLLRQLAEQDGKLYLVPACLTAKGHEAFASKMAAEKGEVGK